MKATPTVALQMFAAVYAAASDESVEKKDRRMEVSKEQYNTLMELEDYGLLTSSGSGTGKRFARPSARGMRLGACLFDVNEE